MPLGMEVGLGPDDTVLHSDPTPAKIWHSSSPLFGHVYCGQTAGWIKMPLGMEVDLGPGHIVLDGDRVPHSERGTAAPTFRPMYSMAIRLDGSKMPLGMKVGLGPGNIVLDRDPVPTKNGAQPPHFSLISIVAKRLGGSRCHLVRR